MGTMIQALKLDEEGYRGARFDAWNREVRGNNDLLNFSRPDAVRDIHLAYFRAGADIVSTNTFSSTAIAQADYGMEDIAYELNLEPAPRSRARRPPPARERRRPPRVSSPAHLGRPTAPPRSRPTSPIPAFAPSPSTNCARPMASRARGLIDGGADLLLIETIFDTLNAKAAIYAIAEICDERGARRAGDDLRHHHRPLGPPAVGPNAGGVLEFGAARRAVIDRAQLRARREGDARPYRRDSAASPTRFVCAYPNAGLPNEFGYYDESPEFMAELLGEFAAAGLVNVVGGCCGTTPEHIARHRARRRGQAAARRSRTCRRMLRLSGLEPFTLTPEIPFVNVGERTNVTGSAKFRKLITAGDYAGGARDRARSGRERRADHRRQHGRGPARFRAAMITFLNLIAAEPDIARVPVMVDSSKFSVIEAGLKCVQGKPVVNSISMKEGEEASSSMPRSCAATARPWW